jgi:ligand-binding sensor domain-containing protein
MKNLLILFLFVLTASCSSQENNVSTDKNLKKIKEIEQIGEYVVESFQDSKGNLWFGTLEEGVAKFDGNKLSYFDTKNGLPSNRVTCVTEDKLGNIWFGTDAGITKFDGNLFINYAEKNGLRSNMVSNLFIDSKGIFWVGTWGGVSKFDGMNFINFDIPYPKVETKINPDTKDWITSITEDSKGNIWIGSDNFGVCVFNGENFSYLTTKEGLNSNSVQSIVEDSEKNMWIGTRVAEKDNADVTKKNGKGGLNRYDGNQIIQFPNVSGLSQNDVYAIYKDKSNDLWIGTTSHGVYKYKNNEFINFKIPKSAMNFLKDKEGNIWVGCAGGLYRINLNGEIVNIIRNGPWN